MQLRLEVGGEGIEGPKMALLLTFASLIPELMMDWQTGSSDLNQNNHSSTAQDSILPSVGR